MKRRIPIGLFLIGSLLAMGSQAQSIAGFWLGVTYPTDPNQAVYNYTMTLTQKGSVLGGTSQTSEPQVPFGGVFYLSGQINLPDVTFTEGDKSGSTAVQGVCFWRGKLTYDSVNESLIGTYENATNGTTCFKSGGGKIELYRIVLKSGTTYCKGSPIHLVVTGKNIQWYASPTSTTPLAKGNTYSPNITQTTTFYITQTLYQTESPAVPITIDVVEPKFTVTTTDPGCDKGKGIIALTPSDSTRWQYRLNGGAYQTTSSFNGLGPGSYTVTATNTAGCHVEQSVTLANSAAPLIDELKLTPPRCGSANGSVNVVASRGKEPFTYSADYGVTFQSSSLFNNLSGGTHTFRVRDANMCEVNAAIDIPATKSIVVLSTTGLPTTCGQANGQVSMTTSGGQAPVQYSIDNQTFQTDHTFAGLQSGNYTVLARDSEGCTTSQRIDVAASTGPQIGDVQTRTQACGKTNGAILVVAEHASDVLMYSIDGQTFQRAATFTELKGGNYTLTAKDTNNCMVTQNVVVPLDCANRIYLPTAFSPNADNVNDGLTVHFGSPSLTISQFTVYDRWGTVLFNRANFELTNGESIWDGQINGQPAPAGIYSYRLHGQYPDGTQLNQYESVSVLIK